MSSWTIEAIKIKLGGTPRDDLFQPPIQSKVSFKVSSDYLGL